MVKLPPWDTPAWRLPRELRPLLRCGQSPAQTRGKICCLAGRELAAARHAVGAAAVELVRRVDAMWLFKAERATVGYFGRA
jgi:hypothetical protein